MLTFQDKEIYVVIRDAFSTTCRNRNLLYVFDGSCENSKSELIMENKARNELAKILQISKNEQSILDEGSNHPGSCRCETCRQWWKLMGTDYPEEGSYGPFTKEEIEVDDNNGIESGTYSRN